MVELLATHMPCARCMKPKNRGQEIMPPLGQDSDKIQLQRSTAGVVHDWRGIHHSLGAVRSRSMVDGDSVGCLRFGCRLRRDKPALKQAIFNRSRVQLSLPC